MSQCGVMLCDNPGDSADYYGVGSGDLCIPFARVRDSTWGYVFGDCWDGQEQGGNYLGSPIMLDQDSFDSAGASAIAFTWAEPKPQASRLFDYADHADNGYGYEVSRIPNDCVEYNGRTFIQYTSVDTWVRPHSFSDGSRFAGIAYSDDYGDTWADFATQWDGDRRGNNGSVYMMWTFAGIDTDADKIYIFSKPWNGSHNYNGDNARIILFRMSLADFYDGDFSNVENWHYGSGTWSWCGDLPATPLFAPGNNLGELSVKKIGSTWVMSYFDCTDRSIKTRTAAAVDGIWSDEKIQVVHNKLWPPSHWGKPQQRYPYGGYIHPGSASTSNLCLIVSQWNGTLGARPYTATQWTGLTAQPD